MSVSSLCSIVYSLPFNCYCLARPTGNKSCVLYQPIICLLPFVSPFCAVSAWLVPLAVRMSNACVLSSITFFAIVYSILCKAAVWLGLFTSIAPSTLTPQKSCQMFMFLYSRCYHLARPIGYKGYQLTVSCTVPVFTLLLLGCRPTTGHIGCQLSKFCSLFLPSRCRWLARPCWQRRMSTACVLSCLFLCVVAAWLGLLVIKDVNCLCSVLCFFLCLVAAWWLGLLALKNVGYLWSTLCFFLHAVVAWLTQAYLQ